MAGTAADPEDRRAATAAAGHEALSRRSLFGLGFLKVLPEALGGIAAEAPASPPAPRGPDMAAIKERACAAWSLGDPGELGRTLEPAAEVLVEAVAIVPGTRVLDVGAGDGNLALAAARRGADVVAGDLSPTVVEHGLARSRAAGEDVSWGVADAEALPYADGRFDVAASCFGAIHAPTPGRVSAELFRVTRPGGAVAMTAWTSSGFIGRMLNLVADHLGHPRAVPRPAQWGRYESIYRAFLSHTDDFDSSRRSLRLEAASAEAMWEWLSRVPGELAAGLPSLSPAARAGLQDAAGELISEHGYTGPDAHWVVDADYELILARKPD